ncbi:hypothetical protein OAO87_04745, partial [bacterium]|nr:hypothetical protein [bacterium]
KALVGPEVDFSNEGSRRWMESASRFGSPICFLMPYMTMVCAPAAHCDRALGCSEADHAPTAAELAFEPLLVGFSLSAPEGEKGAFAGPTET